MPKGTPLTKAEQEKRRLEIYHTVVKIFLKRDFRKRPCAGLLKQLD
ncbi:MAG TPA: hypothetical protein VLA72_08990 [Anaerolineales bacterium]|nr:hypothetical protein [Anaerolineales bacterium]